MDVGSATLASGIAQPVCQIAQRSDRPMMVRKRVASQQVDPAFFEISNFRLVPATGVLVEHLGGSLDMQASEGAVEGAPAEVVNAPVLDVGELPEQLLFALSSAWIHQQSSNA